MKQKKIPLYLYNIYTSASFMFSTYNRSWIWAGCLLLLLLITTTITWGCWGWLLFLSTLVIVHTSFGSSSCTLSYWVISNSSEFVTYFFSLSMILSVWEVFGIFSDTFRFRSICDSSETDFRIVTERGRGKRGGKRSKNIDIEIKLNQVF